MDSKLTMCRIVGVMSLLQNLNQWNSYLHCDDDDVVIILLIWNDLRSSDFKTLSCIANTCIIKPLKNNVTAPK